MSTQRPAGKVALEACGSAHWWARKIKALGHEVVLLHAKYIRPFVQTNKTDAADARAIWTAVQQPQMRTVAAKTEDQQAMLSLHRMRCVKTRNDGDVREFGLPGRAVVHSLPSGNGQKTPQIILTKSFHTASTRSGQSEKWPE